MKHYGISEWVDFARGLVSDALNQEMRYHLSTGCDECLEVASFCEKLKTVCGELIARPAPEWLTRAAKSRFELKVTATPRRRPVRIPLELVYDSLLAPAPVGLRATCHTGWQALYRGGNCCLDLRVEPELGGRRAAVIGQISNTNQPDEAMEDVPVLLKSGGLIIAETRSNRFGEFQLEYEQLGKLQLCVNLHNGVNCVQVALKKVNVPVGP